MPNTETELSLLESSPTLEDIMAGKVASLKPVDLDKSSLSHTSQGKLGLQPVSSERGIFTLSSVCSQYLAGFLCKWYGYLCREVLESVLKARRFISFFSVHSNL